MITSSDNGIISLVGILPNRIIQPIAEHSEYPVERLAFSHGRKFLGSISHDQTLKLWDLDDLLQGSGNIMPNHSPVPDSDSDGMDMDDSIPKPSKGTVIPMLEAVLNVVPVEKLAVHFHAAA